MLRVRTTLLMTMLCPIAWAQASVPPPVTGSAGPARKGVAAKSTGDDAWLKELGLTPVPPLQPVPAVQAESSGAKAAIENAWLDTPPGSDGDDTVASSANSTAIPAMSPPAEAEPRARTPEPAQAVVGAPVAGLSAERAWGREVRPSILFLLHPLPLVLRGQALVLEIELALSGHLSAFMGPSLAYSWVEGSRGFAGGLEIGARYYFGGSAPEGFFAGPSLGLVMGSVSSDQGHKVPSNGFALGAHGGRTFLIRNLGAVSAGAGLQYTRMTADSSTPFARSGFGPSVRLAVGFGL
jgi:hypothetical protein